jgi:hypothetical protein
MKEEDQKKSVNGKKAGRNLNSNMSHINKYEIRLMVGSGLILLIGLILLVFLLVIND